MRALIKSIIAKFQSGEMTFVEVVRAIRDTSDKILSVIDGVPIMGADGPEDIGEVMSALSELHELVTGEPPAMNAAQPTQFTSKLDLLMLLFKLAQLLKERSA